MEKKHKSEVGSSSKERQEEKNILINSFSVTAIAQPPPASMRYVIPTRSGIYERAYRLVGIPDDVYAWIQIENGEKVKGIDCTARTIFAWRKNGSAHAFMASGLGLADKNKIFRAGISCYRFRNFSSKKRSDPRVEFKEDFAIYYFVTYFHTI